jgi:hypothetical protein
MNTSNIHEIRKKAAVSITVKIITGHLLRTVWYNISNIENRGLEGVGIIKRATCSSNGFTMQTGCQEKKRIPTDHNPARANGDHPKRGQENYSIDLPIDIVGISEMQKCGLKYDMLSLSSIVLQRYGIRTAD